MLELLKLLLRMVSDGSSKDAPAATIPAGTVTPSPTPIILRIERKTLSKDGVFGKLYNNGIYVCETVENLGKEIPEGLYTAVLDVSPRLGYLCPHIRVPIRDTTAGGDAGIRIHKANQPCQLEGCIATGDSVDGDAVDDSKDAFDRMMSNLPQKFQVLIYAIH